MNTIRLNNAIRRFKSSSYVSISDREAPVTKRELNNAIDNTAKLFEEFLKEMQALDKGR